METGIDHQDTLSYIASLVRQCERHLEDHSKERERALEYYNGEMKDFPSDEGRSSLVSRDIRASIKKLMPSIMRTIMSNDKIVEYEPVGEGDEEKAEQATDYINHVVVPECGAENALNDAIFDALILKTGILKWAAYTKRKAEVHNYTNLTDDAMLGLSDDPDLEIFDHEKTLETDPLVLALDPNARRHSFKLRRVVEEKQVRLEAIPRGSFLMFPGAETIEDAPLVGEIQEETRSHLVSIGYDRDDVYRIRPLDFTEDTDDASRKGDDEYENTTDTRKEMETVLVYEVYVKLDIDDDGIAEMYRVVFGEEAGEDGSHRNYVLLEQEPVSEAPYSDVVAERDAHQFEGHSTAEDLEDIQRATTGLLRQTFDNITWQNNPMPAVDLDQVEDPEPLYNPEFGQPVILKKGGDAQRALQFLQVPFFADRSFEMLGYFEETAKDRTGVTDASGGVDPEAFQNMAATNAMLLNESGVAQAEMIIRSLTKGGIKKAFRGLLRLVVAHHDQPRTVRIRKKWVDYDPTSWNVDMDCTVNVGLGAGSRERDMSVLQVILGLQREVISTMGADNPYVKPDQLYNTFEKITETAGFPSADPYFTKPDPVEVADKLASANQPDPQTVKVQMQMELEKVKALARERVEEAQMKADLLVKEAEREKDLQIAALQAQVDLLKHGDQMELEAMKAGLAGPTVPEVGLPDMING